MRAAMYGTESRATTDFLDHRAADAQVVPTQPESPRVTATPGSPVSGLVTTPERAGAAPAGTA
jgi:hypothetical protein